MNKLVCLDPPYSKYFNDLAKAVEEKLGYHLEKECLTYNKSNKLYLPDFKIVTPKLTDRSKLNCADYEFVKNIASLSNVKATIEDELAFQQSVQAYVALENYIKKNRNALYFIYNDLRWNHAYAVDILRKQGCKYFVFERGVFRPHSTTMDCRGVNANSMVRDLKVVDINDQDKQELESVFFKDRSERPAKFEFAKYFISSKLTSSLFPPSIKAVSKSPYRKSLGDYINLHLSNSKNKKSTPTGNGFKISDEKFIFVPLQLSNDTQTLINSPYSGTQDFIDKVVADYRDSNFYLNVKLVFKKHPLDLENYEFPEDVFVSNEETNDLIDSSDFCITINSTVGFEALFSKKVLCLGKSFYTEHGFVGFVEPHENIFENHFISQPADNYKYFILKHYQVPGSIFNYTKSDLSYTAERIIRLGD